MENEILDHFEENKIDPRHFQKRAAQHLKIIGLCLVVLVVVIPMATGLPRQYLVLVELASTILLLVCIGTGMRGFYFGIRSYIKKEPFSRNRFLVLLGNGVFLLLFIAVILINIFDLLRVL